MWRLLFLQLWDHLPPLYLVLFPPFTPGLPFQLMSQEALLAAWIALFPHHLWDIDCAALDPRNREVSRDPQVSLSWSWNVCIPHVIALPKSRIEFKGSLLEHWGTYLLLERVDFYWCWPDAWRGCALAKGIFFYMLATQNLVKNL